MLWEYGGGADDSAAGSELGQGSFLANPFFYFLRDPVVRELCCSQLLSRVPTLRPPWTSESHRLLCPWNSPDKNTGLSCHFLLQGIFLTRDGSLISCIYCI